MASVPNWLHSLLKAEFKSVKDGNSGRKNYNLFCFSCMKAIRGIDKLDHPDHEFLQVVKATNHFAVRVSDIIQKLDCQGICKFSINHYDIYHLNTRDESLALPPKKRPRYDNSVRTCASCNWKLQDKSLYCSLHCKFKKVMNSSKESSGSNNGDDTNIKGREDEIKSIQIPRQEIQPAKSPTHKLVDYGPFCVVYYGK